MTAASAVRPTQLRTERLVRIQQRRDRRIERVRRAPLAGMAAALVTFIAAWEPNAALRYGPFIAVGALLLSRPLQLKIGATEWAMGLFILWAVLSQFWTDHPHVFVSRLILASSLAIIFIGVHAATRLGQNAALAVGGYVVGCLYGLAQTTFQLITGSGPIYRDGFGRITQVGALNINYVAYTTITAIVLILLVLQSRQIQHRRLKLIMLATLAVLVLGGLSTQTRGVQISILLLGAWVLISKFGRPVKLITTVCALAIMSVSFGWVDDMLGLFDGGDRSISGLSGRLPLWESARSTWEDSVFTGAGLGADRAQNISNLATHNTVLGLGATLGVVGLVLFATFAISAVNRRSRDLSAPVRRFRLLTILIAFTPILLTSSWEWSASGWVGLALLSTPILAATREPHPDLDLRSALQPLLERRGA